MKPSESPTFCPLMWLGANHWNSGVFAPCCQYQPTQETETWSNGFDDRPYRDQRKLMAEGGKPNDCKQCWSNESAGAWSLRNEALDMDWWHPYVDIIDATTGEDGSFKHQPVYFDLRLGTKCNLACRMCSPTSSSLIEKEIDEHFTIYKDLGFQMKDYADAKKNITTDQHIDQVFDYIQSVDRPINLKFTGGEPFLNKRIPGFIDNLIDSGRSKNITLMFITNLTTVQRSMLEKIKGHFKKFSLNISMEGIGDAYEYIRYPSTWQKFQKNYDIIKEVGITHGVCYTGNSVTIGNFNEWLDWAYEQRVGWDFNPVVGPPHYCISCLPFDYKEKIIKDINEWKSRHPGYRLMKELDSAIGWLKQRPDKEAWLDLKKDTNLKDAIRKQSIHKSIPKLAAYF